MTGEPLVLVVGSHSARREELARCLIDRGRAVILCGGPPACPLVRGDRCVVVNAADAVVLLEPRPPHRDAALGLLLCSEEARRAVTAESTAAAGDIADRVDAELARR